MCCPGPSWNSFAMYITNVSTELGALNDSVSKMLFAEGSVPSGDGVGSGVGSGDGDGSGGATPFFNHTLKIISDAAVLPVLSVATALIAYIPSGKLAL